MTALARPLDAPALTRTVMVAWPSSGPLAAAAAMIETLAGLGAA